MEKNRSQIPCFWEAQPTGCSKGNCPFMHGGKIINDVYKVTKIKGKGLGCVAITDIEKGSLILTENPQICGNTEEEEGSSKWIKSLMKSFKRMKKTDQLEYMELHSKYNNFQGSDALSFYESEMILYRPNHLGALIRSK